MRLLIATAAIVVSLSGLLAEQTPAAQAQGPALKETFPRLMGMTISFKDYHDPVYATRLARFDVVILSFYTGWNENNTANPVGDAVRAIKRRNPNILIGQYSVLNESYELGRWDNERDIPTKLDAQDWWLRTADGKKVQWTDEYDTWETNATEWTKPDANGQRLPEWLAQRYFDLYFGPVPEFDIWYFDNTGYTSSVGRADWDLDGRDDSSSDPRIGAAIRRGQRAHWAAARALAPRLILMGNVSVTNDLGSPEHREQLGGAYLEGMMGLSWSLERQRGWPAMMERYLAVSRNTAPPHLVGFHVAGRHDDYRQVRYGLTSCLLGNGYFVYSDVRGNDRGVWWYDEYDLDLGRAISPEQSKAWQNRVFRRDFENGIVLVNPTGQSRSVEVESGFRRFQGKQDPKTNNGEPVGTVNLPPRDGIVLIRDGMSSADAS